MIVFLFLLALIAPIVIVEPLDDSVVLPKLATTFFFTGGALMWGAVLLVRDRWPAGRWPVTLWGPAVIFVLVNVAALIFSDNWRASLAGENWRYAGLASTILYMLLFGVAAVAVRTTRDLRWLLLGLFAGALGTAIYALFQKAGLDWAAWSGSEPDRPISTLGQQNTFAAFLVVAISASTFLVLTVKHQQARFRLALTVTLLAAVTGAFGLLLMQTDGWQRVVATFVGGPFVGLALGGTAFAWVNGKLDDEALRYPLEAALGASIMLMLFALLFTVSRSAYGAMIVVVAIWGAAGALWFLTARRGQRPRLENIALAGVAGLVPAVLVVTLGAAFFVGLPSEAVGLGRVPERVQAAANLESPEVSVRLSLWRLGLDMTRDRPLLGYGQDGFSLKFSEYRDRPDLPGIGTTNVDPESAHNAFIDIASGTGFLGLASFLALVAAVLWHASRRALTSEDLELRIALVALGAASIGYLVAIFFGFTEALTTWVFWLILGATAGLVARVPAPHEAGAETSPESGSLASGLCAVALFVVGVAAIGWAGTVIAADLAAAQAHDAANRRDYDSAVSLAGRAVTLNPLKKDYLILKARNYERAAEAQGTAKEYALAVEAYRTLLNRHGPDSFYTLKLAQAEAKLAKAQGIPVSVAFPDLERAVELDLFNLPLREYVADFYEREGFAGLGFNHRVAIHCWTEGCDLSGQPE